MVRWYVCYVHDGVSFLCNKGSFYRVIRGVSTVLGSVSRSCHQFLGVAISLVGVNGNLTFT